jgi:hypothetical protein
MTAALVPMELTQGEDYTAQIIWTDDYDEPQPVVAPCRLDIVGPGNQVMLTLQTPETALAEGEIPEIGLSTEIGLIQLHIPREQTKGLNVGAYSYDLFVTVDDGGAYAGDQQLPIIGGPVTVNKRYTKM